MNQEKEIQKAILEEKQRLEKGIADAEKSVESFEDRIITQIDKKMEATKEIKRKLSEIEKPYDDIIQHIREERDKISSQKHKMTINLNTVEERIRAKFAEKLSEFPDDKSFRGYLLSVGIHTHTIELIKKRLPNNVILFRHYESYYTSSQKHTSSDSKNVAYFAVKGKNIIGFIFTRKSRHPGDCTDVDCWINSKYLRNSNQLSKHTYSSPPTIGFKKWKELLSQLTDFISIDLTDEKNKKILSSYYHIDHDAMED